MSAFSYPVMFPLYLQIDEEELKEFSALADENGEITKTDLIVQTKASKFWKGYMEAKSRPGALTSKVRIS